MQPASDDGAIGGEEDNLWDAVDAICVGSNLKLKPQFYSQRRVREFLMGGNGMNGEELKTN